MKHNILLLIILFLLSSNESYGFVNQRYEWWRLRLKSLNQEKQNTVKDDKLDKSIISLINNEIRRVKEILKIFESKNRNDSCLSYEERFFRETEVKKVISDIVTPLFSLHYLEYLIKNIGSNNCYIYARNTVREYLDTQIKSRLKNSDEEFSKSIIEKITKSSWKYLAMEILLNSMIKNRQRLYEISQSEIEKCVFMNSRTQDAISHKELKDMVQDIAEEYLSIFDVRSNLSSTQDSLEDSWCWNEIYRNIENDFEYKDINSDRVFEDYGLRLSRNRIYIDFIESLIEDCINLASIESSSIHKRFNLSIRRTTNIFKVINYFLTYNKRNLACLNASQINEIRNMKAEFIKKIKTVKYNINYYCSTLNKKRNEMNRSLIKKEMCLIDRIAEYEIELIYSKIKEYISVYDSLLYNKKAFADYCVKFHELQKEVAIGKISNSLEYVIRIQSIFPILKDFNKDRIKREYATKKYLKIELRRDIARLQTLIRLYKRKGIVVKNKPVPNEIREIQSKLGKCEEVLIASWRMNDINFEDVDRKAVKKLTMIRNRNIWNSDAKIKKNSKHGNFIQLKGLRLSLIIPYGWTEQDLDRVESERGIIRSFRSLDRQSSIYIAKIDLNGKSEKTLTDIWIKKMGREKIKERWGKKDNLSYLWALSNNKKSEIMEVYAISRGTQLFLLSGITTKNKYNYFKSKIISVFNSVSTLL